MDEETTEVTPQATPEEVTETPTQEETPVEAVEEPVTTEEPVLTAPGSKEDAEPTLGEHTTVPQPEAPVGSPATAAPAQDAVTMNSHLSKVATDLTLVKEYIQAYLANHPAGTVVSDIESIIQTVRNLIK